MRHRFLRDVLFAAAAFMAACLVPAVAFGWDLTSGQVASLDWVVKYVGVITVGYTLLSVGLLEGIEQIRDAVLNRPSWFVLRIWTVGMVGWGLSAAVTFAVSGMAQGIVDQGSMIETASVVFIVTIPAVCQAAYIADLWRRRGRLVS